MIVGILSEMLSNVHLNWVLVKFFSICFVFSGEKSRAAGGLPCEVDYFTFVVNLKWKKLSTTLLLFAVQDTSKEGVPFL